MTKKLLLIIAIDLLAALLMYSAGLHRFLINFEIALLSGSVIILATFRSYRTLVIKSGDADLTHYKDAVEKLEDPFDLYDDEVPTDDTSLKMNKIKTEHMKNAIKTKAGFFSFGRVAGYLLLIGSLFSLKNHQLFDIPGYLVGLAAGIVLAVWIKRDHTPLSGEDL